MDERKASATVNVQDEVQPSEPVVDAQDGGVNLRLLAGLVAIPVVAAALIFGAMQWRQSNEMVQGPVVVDGKVIDSDLVLRLDPVVAMSDENYAETIAAVEAVDGVASVVFSPSPIVQGIVPDAPTLSYGDDLLLVTIDESATKAEVSSDISGLQGVLEIQD